MTFAAAFDLVCRDYTLSPESRAVAWDSCHHLNGAQRKRAVSIYLALARSRPPFEASAASGGGRG